ncbi:MAG: RES family NAD+ phosphorylase, partial [Gemmatimonadaceae bacterium]
GTASLAALEKLVWVDPDDMPDDLVLYEILLPDDAPCARLHAAHLPAGWTEPGSPACLERGQQWLAGGRELALIVPSAVLPDATDETNVLVNPRHPDAGRAQVLGATPFHFDLRLLR